MTDEERQRRDIERDERWLAGACKPSEPIDTERIKQRVRVEIGERWLDAQITDEVPADFAARLRERVRREVRATQAGTSGKAMDRSQRKRRIYFSIGGAAGLAAAIAIAWIGFAPDDLVLTEPGPEMELLHADAFEQYEDDEFDVYLSELRDDMTQLATGPVDGSIDDTLGGLFDDQAGEDGDPTQLQDTTDGPVGMSHWPTGSGV